MQNLLREANTKVAEFANTVNSNRSKIFNLGLILLALIIAYNFVYKRQAKEEQFLKQKINEQTGKNEVLSGIGKSEKTINAYKKLLTKKDANVIITSIGNIAKLSGIKIMSIRPMQEQRNPDYIKVPFNLALAAPNYHTIGKFVSEIENSQDVYMVEAVNIGFKGEAKELSVDLTVSYIAIIN